MLFYIRVKALFHISPVIILPSVLSCFSKDASLFCVQYVNSTSAAHQLKKAASSNAILHFITWTSRKKIKWKEKNCNFCTKTWAHFCVFLLCKGHLLPCHLKSTEYAISLNILIQVFLPFYIVFHLRRCTAPMRWQIYLRNKCFIQQNGLFEHKTAVNFPYLWCCNQCGWGHLFLCSELMCAANQ